MALTVLAHAKVNLSLEVGPVRADGYHPYGSWATSVGLADTLTLTRRQGVFVTTTGGLQDTLVGRALDALGAGDVHVRIDKTIPAGAGLGGGSADAAAALVAARRLLRLPLSDGNLLRLAATIGTDVPFCVAGGHARLHGRGELVEPAPPLPPFGILVAVPPVHVSTAAVFDAFDRIGCAPDPPAPPTWLARLLPECSFRNDLEPAAHRVAPELGRYKERIEAAAGRPAHMTGSGSGYVCFAEAAAEFAGAVAELASAGIAAWATTPVPAGVSFPG